MRIDSDLYRLAVDLGRAAKARKVMLATAESCTGGLVAGAITAVPGSSGWFERGFVTYSNAAKNEQIGVAAATIARYGAVSEQTALEMARGAIAASEAQWAVAITGIAGPSGGSADKPVGTVCFAWAGPGGGTAVRLHLPGDRAAIRHESVAVAIRGLIDRLS